MYLYNLFITCPSLDRSREKLRDGGLESYQDDVNVIKMMMMMMRMRIRADHDLSLSLSLPFTFVDVCLLGPRLGLL